jgi:hypothetical protein
MKIVSRLGRIKRMAFVSNESVEYMVYLGQRRNGRKNERTTSCSRIAKWILAAWLYRSCDDRKRSRDGN